MAIEKIKVEYEIVDNMIIITSENGFEDNSIYEIRIKTDNDGDYENNFEEQNIKFVSALSPSYCKIIDVESLISIVDIPADIILYNIREASLYANYLYEKIKDGEIILMNNVPFYIKEFVRYKAAKDCLMKVYMSLITSKTVEGMLGEVKFKIREQIPDLKALLQYLDLELQKWIDAIKDKDIEGRARMKSAIKGSNYKTIYDSYKSTDGYGLGPVPLELERRLYK